MSDNIKDKSGDKRYFTIIPNVIDDMKLSPFAKALYLHLKRVAGDNGKCWQSQRTLSNACCMSTFAVVKAKKELAAAGLIEIEVHKGEHGGKDYHVIAITDIWSENMQSFTKSDQDITDTLQGSENTYQDSRNTLQGIDTTLQGSDTRLKKNSIKKNPLRRFKEEEEESATASENSLSQLESVFWSATGFPIPGNERDKAFGNLQSIQLQGNLNTAYLQPFFQAWIQRDYRKTNTSWLDWAVVGEIPPDKRKQKNEPKGFQGIRDYMALQGQQSDLDADIAEFFRKGKTQVKVLEAEVTK
jgi:hypothetical protein